MMQDVESACLKFSRSCESGYELKLTMCLTGGIHLISRCVLIKYYSVMGFRYCLFLPLGELMQFSICFEWIETTN